MKLKLSALVDNAAGKDGNLVVRRSRSGPIAVPRTLPITEFNDAQLRAQTDLGGSAVEFTKLTQEQIDAWNDYGASRTKTNPVNGKHYAQTGINAYTELATVFKRASPGAAAPVLPPVEGFAGDGLELTLSTDDGAFIVAGSGATSAGTLIEILAVGLTRSRRTPRAGYVSRGFFALNAANSYLARVNVGPGVYAVRARYVNGATGQATSARGLGRATVLQLVVGGVDANVDLATGEVMGSAAPAVQARGRKAA